MTLDPDQLHGGDALGDTLARLRDATRPARIVVGWATVDLDRAEAEVGGSPAYPGLLGDIAFTVVAAPPDRALGAACRILRTAAGREVILLEPNTEGLLAAALARYGEGSLVAYLVTDGGAVERARSSGFALTSERAGPLGPQRVVLGGPRSGPFVALAGLGE